MQMLPSDVAAPYFTDEPASAAAVAELRNVAQQPPPPSLPRPISERLPDTTRRCYEALEEVSQMYRSVPGELDRKLLDTAVHDLSVAVARLRLWRGRRW